MKKIIATLVFLCVVAAGAFGQTNLLNVNKYFSLFSIKRSADIADSIYVLSATSDDETRFAGLWGDMDYVDTPLEFALLSYYSPPVLKIRPKEADAILPANNPKLADQKLGAAVFQEIQILRFLGDTAAVNRHEAVLQFITGRGNATRAEIETYYRNGIRGLVSAVVDGEFNKVSFGLDKGRPVSYNAVLMRDSQTGQYILSYGGIYTNGEIRTVTGNSVDALLTAMRNGTNKVDFSQLSIDTVRAQAALIPAAALNNVALDDVKTILTAFYTTPNTTTYNAVKEMYALFIATWARSGQRIFENIRSGCAITLSELNPALAKKVWDDANKVTSFTTLTREQQQRLVGLR